MTTFILVVLGLLFLFILFMMFRKGKKSPPPMPQKDLANLRITDARVKDLISIPAAGDEFEDLDFVVDRKNRYESGEDVWYELSGLYKERRVFVEYEEDDELEVSLNKGLKSLSLSDLGLTEDEIGRMDEEHDSSNGFDFDGQRWNYVSSREVGFFKDGRGEGEGYYCWNFESEDGRRQLFIEKWEGEPFEGGLAETVNPNDIKVYRS